MENITIGLNINNKYYIAKLNENEYRLDDYLLKTKKIDDIPSYVYKIVKELEYMECDIEIYNNCHMRFFK